MSPFDAVRYVLLGGRYRGPVAMARALFVYLVLRYDSETCFDCGRRVGQSIGSHWRTSNRLWNLVYGHEGGILCVRCFVERADAADVRVHVHVAEGV